MKSYVKLISGFVNTRGLFFSQDSLGALLNHSLVELPVGIKEWGGRIGGSWGRRGGFKE